VIQVPIDQTDQTEQHVVAPGKPKIGSRPKSVKEPSTPAEGKSKGKRKGKGKSKKPIVIAVLVVVVLGAGYWFFLRPSGGSDAVAVEPAPEPGEVLVVEPISLNLADGHYLRIGLGLQLTADVAEAPDTARALDLVVSSFSGRTVSEVISTEGREALRAELLADLTEAYEGEVMGVYFTDYVTQ
jgi:flagellar protein FliL